MSDDAEVYRSTGHLLLRTSKSDVEKELSERKEILELRMRTLEKQENVVRNQIEEVRRSIGSLASHGG